MELAIWAGLEAGSTPRTLHPYPLKYSKQDPSLEPISKTRLELPRLKLSVTHLAYCSRWERKLVPILVK